MRAINRIIVHCTATREGADYSAADIDRWHHARGWSGIGYHAVVRLDGTIEPGRDLSHVGAHVTGHNANSLGLVYVGGCAADGKTPKDTRTPEQYAAILAQVAAWMERFDLPVSAVLGHYELDHLKACPSFDMQQFRRELFAHMNPAPAHPTPALDLPVLRPPYPATRAAELLRVVLDAADLTDTAARVRMLQSGAGLPADGIVGPKTWPILIDFIGNYSAAQSTAAQPGA